MIDLSEYISSGVSKKEIFDSYYKNLDGLTDEKRQHFLVRANKANLCDRWTVMDALHTFAKTANRYIDLLYRKNYGEIANEYAAMYKRDPSPRKQKVGKYFGESLKDKNAVRTLALARTFDMVDTYIRNGFSDLIDLDKFQKAYSELIVSVEEFMKSDDFIQKHFENAVVTYTNLWWYSYNYSIDRKVNPTGKRISKTVMNKMREWLRDKYSEGSFDIETVIYGLTHVVIGSTRFYTLGFSNDYLPEIYLLADSIRKFHTEDISLETALCLKMSGMPEYQQLVRKAVRSAKIASEDGCKFIENFKLEKDLKTDLNANEHTNSLYIMCCI